MRRSASGKIKEWKKIKKLRSGSLEKERRLLKSPALIKRVGLFLFYSFILLFFYFSSRVWLARERKEVIKKPGSHQEGRAFSFSFFYSFIFLFFPILHAREQKLSDAKVRGDCPRVSLVSLMGIMPSGSSGSSSYWDSHCSFTAWSYSWQMAQLVLII